MDIDLDIWYVDMKVLAGYAKGLIIIEDIVNIIK